MANLMDCSDRPNHSHSDSGSAYPAAMDHVSDSPGWEPPEWHESVGSTNDLIAADPRPGRVVVAHHQSAGRGRRGRRWEAPPHAALAVSVAIPAAPPGQQGWVSLAAGWAVTRAFEASRWAVPVGLKWPNDVLAHDDQGWRKICGILAQSSHHPRHGPVVVLGVGINVDQRVDELPVHTATSWRLARGGEALPEEARERWLEDYLRHLAGTLANPLSIRPGYLQRCRTIGEQVEVHLPQGVIERGVAIEVDGAGALVLDRQGRRARYLAGDVVHVRR